MRWIAFEKLGEPDTQYLCLFCMMASQSNEIYISWPILYQTAIISSAETTGCITSLQSLGPEGL